MARARGSKGPVVVGSSDTFADLKIGRDGYACYVGVSGVTFNSVRFTGGGGSYTTTSPYLDSHVITIGGGNVSNVLFDSCEVERNAGTEDSTHSRHFDNVFISDGVSAGQGLVHDVLFKDTHFGVSNGTASGSPRMNVEIWEDHSAASRVQGFSDINFEGCVFEAADDENIDYAGASLSSDNLTPASGYSHVTGCTFKGNGASWVWYNDITVEGGAGYISASGNTFYRGAGFAMAMEGSGGHNAFTNNVIDSTNNVLNTGITHDYVAYVDIASANNTVTGNTITDTGPSPWCIDLEDTSSQQHGHRQLPHWGWRLRQHRRRRQRDCAQHRQLRAARRGNGLWEPQPCSCRHDASRSLLDRPAAFCLPLGPPLPPAKGHSSAASDDRLALLPA